MNYKPVIGLEVHVELGTNSKMFCGCSADFFGKEPNVHTCPVCLGLPGALPVPNKKAVEWTILIGLALGCEINTHSKFDRKNYFYPDLPKGYQISQYDEPLAVNGKLAIKDKEIRIRRVHIEEDTGKLQHTNIDGKEAVLVDLNRSGVPLVEIVTEPDFETIEEVDEYVKKLQKIIRYLGVSSADMEKGSMRLEPSISVRPEGETTLPPYRVELKNINSFRFARKALEFELARQSEALSKGEKLPQETRGWNETKNETVSQRRKEEENDYRYFPEPDIPPMVFSDETIVEIKSQLPELPDAKAEKFVKEYGVTDYDAAILAENKELADYFEKAATDKTMAKQVANWIINKKVDTSNVEPTEVIALIKSSKATGVVDIKVIEQVLSENPGIVESYKAGKTGVIGFLMSKIVAITPDVDKAELMTVLKQYLER